MSHVHAAVENYHTPCFQIPIQRTRNILEVIPFALSEGAEYLSPCRASPLVTICNTWEMYRLVVNFGQSIHFV
jgi:hypothetical protein